MTATIIELMENFLLLENKKRLDFLKDKHKDGFDTSHDTLAKHKDHDAIIDHFAKKADPTSNKEHTQWILDQYKKQNIRQEDATQIKRDLKDFEKAKPHLEKKDLNQYKHISDMRDAVASKITHAKKLENEKKKAEENKKEDLKHLYSEDGVEGYKIPNRESSIRNYGPGGVKAKTNWCTAANSKSNMFNHYSGGKYTMHFPNGHVLQFHHQSRQIMDEKDRPVDDTDPRYEPYMHHINKFIEHTHKLEKEPWENLVGKYKTYTPEEVKQHMDNLLGPEKSFFENAHERILKKHDISDEHFHKMVENYKTGVANGESHYSQNRKALGVYLSSNPLNNTHHIDHIMKQDNSIFASKKQQIMENSNRSVKALDHHLDNFEKYQTETQNDRGAQHLLSAKNLNDSHMHRLLDKHKPSDNDHWEEAIGGHDAKQLSHETQNKLMDKVGNDAIYLPRIAGKLLRNQDSVSPKAVDHVASKLDANPNDTHAQADVALHMSKKTSPDSYLPHHYEKIVKAIPSFMEHSPDYASTVTHHIMHAGNEGSDIHGEAAKNTFLNNLDKISAKTHTPDSMTRLFKSSKMTNEDLHHAWVNSENLPNVRRALISNPKIGDDKINQHLDAQIENGNIDIATRHALLNNPKAKPEHLEKMVHHTAEYNVDEILDHSKINHESMNRLFDGLRSHDHAARLLQHPKVTETMQHKAVTKPHMHGLLSTSQYTMPSILDKLSKSPASYIRNNVASHKNTSPETLKRLSQDENAEVAETAKKKVK